jgi:hypothetical protein
MTDILQDAPESHRDLLQSPLTATPTTIDADRRPRSTAAWYLVDDDGGPKGSTTSGRRRFKNLKRNSTRDLFIIDPANPFRTLLFRAEARLHADPEKKAARRFSCADSVDETVLVRPVGDHLTVLRRPRHIVASPAVSR